MRTLICLAAAVVLLGACGDSGDSDRSVDPTTSVVDSVPVTAVDSVPVTAPETTARDDEADVVIVVEERVSVDDDDPAD